ncbi:hypothetical protein NC653_015337 [Populus alba x Populus x berolinensis]|uniref:Uncharacterized protein n=1 Tax=Populus alba x Populus x berolinensis TaxID=444605 RepID=A0AAD6QK94_9ROSI|nr:hypothetical protein NC653_015337 [Populus alba x Populus x berolinensis]
MGRPQLESRWAELGPKGIGPSSAQKKLHGSGPTPAQTAGLGQNPSGPPHIFLGQNHLAQRSKKLQHGGNYFPPARLLHAERFCMQEANRTQLRKKKMHGEKDSVPGAAETAACWRSCSVVASRTAAPGRRCGCFPTVRRRSTGSFLLFQLLEFPLSFNYRKLLNFWVFGDCFLSSLGPNRCGGPVLVRLGAGFAGGWSATTRDSKVPFLYFRPVVGQCFRSAVPRCGGFGLFGGDAREREAGSLFQKTKLFLLLQLFSFLFSACVGLLSGQAAARLEKNEGVAATLKAGWRQSGGRLLVAAHERRLSSLFTVEPGLSQCWTCCRRGADEDKLAKCKAIMRKGWESVRLKREGKLVCRGKVLAEEGAVTAVGRRALGLKVCWGKQQQRRKGRWRGEWWLGFDR